MTNHNATLKNMITQQLRTGDVLDEHILSLFHTIPRPAFVPEAMKNFAYSDLQIPLAHKQRMLTPLEEGRILQALMLQGHETVLEIGTGSGYFTALLSKLCKQVISVDYFEDFTKTAADSLLQHDCTNVELLTGDGLHGWLEKAPYDIVVMTGGIESVTDTHRLQILPGGKLFVILGQEPVMKAILFSLDHEKNWTQNLLFDTCIPLLINSSKPNEFVF